MKLLIIYYELSIKFSTFIKIKKLQNGFRRKEAHIKNYGEKFIFVIKNQMELSLLESFLPKSMLDYFTIVGFKELGNISTKKMEFELHLDEKNIVKFHKVVLCF